MEEPDYTKVSGANKTVSVNGKTYGPYAEVNDVFVTPDKKIVFFEWMDKKSIRPLGEVGQATNTRDQASV